jgi:hypothetical protein
LSHGTFNYIRMYINAVADSAMLYLQHDSYNIVLKIKYKLYTISGSAPPPSRCAPAVARVILTSVEFFFLKLRPLLFTLPAMIISIRNTEYDWQTDGQTDVCRSVSMINFVVQ